MRKQANSGLLVTIGLLAMFCCQAAGAADRKPVPVSVHGSHPAIRLAGEELVRYLDLMAGDGEAASIVSGRVDRSGAIHLGLFRDFGIPVKGLADPNLDDAIHIDVRDSRGIIAGSNPRSVLFATYRFLEASGCRWLRPGKDGDYVPSRTVHDLTVKLTDKATYRFRGNNNCGTYSLDHLLDAIEWAPKVGLNTFFNEFFLPRMMFNRYHGRSYPSLRPAETRTDAEIWAYHEKSIREIKRRGLLYHAAGHGWTGLVVGAPEAESDHDARPAVPPGKERFLALVGGKRDMSRGPTFTDLCYGNPEVQRLLVQTIADYAERHPEIDYLHVWQDDAMNRLCECELCRDVRAADWYVKVLNGIDAEFSRRGLPTKIVFLIYQDLLWPPEKEKFAKPDRFVMMFAPTRRYNTPYYVGDDVNPIPPYKLNQNQRPTDERTVAAFLRGWQQFFKGEAFVFDYHMTWHHYFDPGYYGLVDVMAEDIRRLPKLGMEGFVSCQVMRSFYPHGFPMYAHARLLWNPTLNTGELAREYFSGAFGEDGGRALQYAQKLSELFSPLYLSMETLLGEDSPEKRAALARFQQVPETVAAFRPVIESHLSTTDAAHRQSWRYLWSHSDLVLKLAEALEARVSGNQAAANAKWTELVQLVAERELETDPVLDIQWFVSTYERTRGLFKSSWKAPERRP